MGSFIEINDTLRLTKAQGFPTELDLARHLSEPYNLADARGKWVYWGLCHVLSIHHDYVKRETSGTFEITYLNSPDEMKQAFGLIDRVEVNNYFKA